MRTLNPCVVPSSSPPSPADGSARTLNPGAVLMDSAARGPDLDVLVDSDMVQDKPLKGENYLDDYSDQ